jgi:hypothetical protein
MLQINDKMALWLAAVLRMMIKLMRLLLIWEADSLSLTLNTITPTIPIVYRIENLMPIH